MNRVCIVDPARTAELWDVGAAGHSVSVVVDSDGTETLWILDRDAGNALPDGDTPRHERRYQLPPDISAAIWGVFLCGTATSRTYHTCRNRVSVRGARCHHHREDIA